MDKPIRLTKIIKVGSSLAFVIPAYVCRELLLRRGDYLDLVISDQDTIIAKRLKVVGGDNFEERQSSALPKINYGK